VERTLNVPESVLQRAREILRAEAPSFPVLRLRPALVSRARRRPGIVPNAGVWNGPGSSPGQEGPAHDSRAFMRS